MSYIVLSLTAALPQHVGCHILPSETIYPAIWSKVFEGDIEECEAWLAKNCSLPTATSFDFKDHWPWNVTLQESDGSLKSLLGKKLLVLSPEFPNKDDSWQLDRVVIVVDSDHRIINIDFG